MKNFKIVIAIIAISLSTVFSASATDPYPSKTKTLRSEMSSFIGNHIPVTIDRVTNVEVSFMINNDNEVVIISINSDISELNSFLKKKLNYKKLTTKGVKKGEVYKMPLKISIK